MANKITHRTDPNTGTRRRTQKAKDKWVAAFDRGMTIQGSTSSWNRSTNQSPSPRKGKKNINKK